MTREIMTMSPFHSTYTKLTGTTEDRRLELQNRAARFFDEDVYHRVFASYESPCILDVGCGIGDMIFDMANGYPACRIFGIDIMQRQIDQAVERHPEGRFSVQNIEQDSFPEDMHKWMEREVVRGFDVISCSAVLLHLSDPVDVLTKLRMLMNPGGTLIVREVDDGLQYAWPDPEGRFETWSRILGRFDSMGDRHFGRKVYSYLKQAGFRTVRLEKAGLPSTSLPEKELLYEMAFPDFVDYLKRRSEDAPENAEYREAYEWLPANIQEIRNCFSREDFIFSIGFMSFTAKI